MKNHSAFLALALSLSLLPGAFAQHSPAYDGLHNGQPSWNGGHNSGHGNGSNGGHNNGHNNGHNGGAPGGWQPPPPPPPPPGGGHYPYPGGGSYPPGPWQNQAFRLESSGSYAFSSEAEAARAEAVRVLTDNRVPVLDSRVEYAGGFRFVIRYSAREELKVTKYQSGAYAFASEARAAADGTAAALKAQGRAVLEKPVSYNGGFVYTVSYVNFNAWGLRQDKFQKFNSVGVYAFSGEAAAARDAAVKALAAAGLPVLEARVDYNGGYRFVVTYCLEEEVPVELYRGGSYSFSSEAKAAAERTADALRAAGKAVIETSVSYNGGYTYTVAYLTFYGGHHYQEAAQTYASLGAYSFSSEAETARAAAVAALTGLRGTAVLESRVYYSGGYRFEVKFTVRRALDVQQYQGGSYPFSGDARFAADQTGASMAAQGYAVLEKNVFYSGGYTYKVAYAWAGW